MKLAHYRCAALVALATAFAPFSALAAKVGDALPALSLKDQFGKQHVLDASVRRIYLNADRKSGDLVKAGMKDVAQETLDAHNAIVITNISEAPGFVKRIILSGLKERRYAVWVDQAGSSKSLPSRADQVTVLDVEAMQIKAIRFVGKETDLQAELKPQPKAK